jgi:hypothetical protein
LEERITCPTLLVVGQGEGEEVLRQGRLLLERLPGEKTIRIAELDEGADAHCVTNNLSLMNQIMFDWLEKAFGLAYARFAS